MHEVNLFRGRLIIKEISNFFIFISGKIYVTMEKEIAPCDIIDFSGQDDFDMIHQLLISQRGTFCFMLDGRNELTDILIGQKRRTVGIYGNRGLRVMVFNATFKNISVISWQSVLLVEEIGVPRKNNRAVAIN